MTRSETQTNDAIAAITDQGAAILTRNLYGTFLAKGQLIQPFDVTATDGDGYWLVHSEARRNATKIKVFREWILEQTADARDHESHKGNVG